MITFTFKEKIGFGLIGIGLITSGLYSLLTGEGGGAAGLTGANTIGIEARITGFVMLIGGLLLIRAIIKSPSTPSNDDKR